MNRDNDNGVDLSHSIKFIDTFLYENGDIRSR